MSDENRTWRIGELAEHAGLTVRALHHYDRIGLLRPQRQGGGQRLYTDADARRLYQIMALRGLGLSLGQIAECLTTDLDPRPLVAEQLRVVSAQIDAATELHDRLARLLGRLDQHPQPSGDDLLALIQAAADVRQLITAYLSDEQLTALARHHRQLGPQAAELARDRMPALYRQALAQYRAGADPASRAVQAIVGEIDRVSATLSGGDESATRGMRRLWAEHGEHAYPGSGIPWADLVAYLDRARAVG